jgi:hypothetical protein
LKGDIAMKARVIRDSKEQDIKARELVPGDIVSFCFPDELRAGGFAGTGRWCRIRELTRPSRSFSRKAKWFRPMVF